MLGVGHALKRPPDVREREDAMRKRSEFALSEQVEHPSDLDGHLLRTQAHRVENQKRDVLAKHRHSQISVLVDVAFADLDESAVFGQNGDALGNRLAGQRVQNQVDSLPAGASHHLVGENERARVHDVLDAQGVEQIAFFGSARRGEHFRPGQLRQLQCRQAHTPCCRVDQHALSGLHSPQMMEGVSRREKRDRATSRLPRRTNHPEWGRPPRQAHRGAC